MRCTSTLNVRARSSVSRRTSSKGTTGPSTDGTTDRASDPSSRRHSSRCPGSTGRLAQRSPRRSAIRSCDERTVPMSICGLFAVTGGGSGIGAGVVRALHAAGADLAVLDLDGTKAKTVAEEVGGTAFEIDVADPDVVDDVFDALGPLRGLVSCAGISGEIVPLIGCSNSEWHRVTGVHLDGTFFCLRGAARNMLRHGVDGTIVNTSSVN